MTIAVISGKLQFASPKLIGVVILLFASCLFLLCACTSQKQKLSQTQAAVSQPIAVGGQPAVTLVRPRLASQDKPHFLEATVLPGHGMNLFQVKAYLPGKGEINLINSPSLEEGKQILEGDDEFGNKSFQLGGAILLPYPNRIRGKLSSDGKTVETTIAGRTLLLPANWHGKKPGAEKHAMHGLIMTAQFADVHSNNGTDESVVSGTLHGGNFGGHWPSETDVNVKTVLRDDALEMTVTATNVGKEDLPMAIAFHPAFLFPSGNREQARLHLPADKRAPANNYDDVFPLGKIVSVKGTPYDFTAPGGAPLGKTFLDDCFPGVQHDADGRAVIEIIDPAAHYGLRLTALSPEVKAIQVYAPPDKAFVTVEPQFNLADPYNRKIWGKTDTGMVSLKPGQSVAWRVRLELFTPNN